MPGAIKVLSFSEGTAVTAPSTTTNFAYTSSCSIIKSASGTSDFLLDMSNSNSAVTNAERIFRLNFGGTASPADGASYIMFRKSGTDLGNIRVYSSGTGIELNSAGPLGFAVGGTNFGSISAAGAVNFGSIHNVGAGNITSGTWTPSPTQITGSYTVAPAFVTGTAKFLRVGSVVWGTFKFTAQPSATTAIELRWSLPVISSNFSAATELTGALQANGSLHVPDPSIQALSSGQLMRIFWTPIVAGGSITYSCVFCFQVP